MSSGISKISYQTQVSLVSISQAPSDSKSVAKMLTAISNAGISIDMISQTAPRGGSISVSFSLSDDVLPRALAVLAKERGNQPELQSEVLPGNCKIAFYDANMVGTPGVAARVFSILANVGVQIMLITTSDVDISILVNSHDLPRALEAVCSAFGVEPIEASAG
ncbi:MAG: ACT domain-containing protein [Oscillospiraceae bacterium]|nr:ACT domain-containing protein [Oscillospiraceae bacterium]